MAVVTAFPLCATDVAFFLKKWQDCLFGDGSCLGNFLPCGKSGEGKMCLHSTKIFLLNYFRIKKKYALIET